ncbi:MAG: hypothetical protein JJE02_06645 [Propionibacteriales bacterium]|nr:hypothetical protein [Propionibacteriales bacterium]
MTPSALWRPVAAMLVFGALGGVVWRLLAKPALWEVTDRGIVLTEDASTARFGVIVVFVLIGVVVSLVWGWYLGGRFHAARWPIVLVAGVTAFVAGVLAWRVGVWLGPPDPSSVEGLGSGDTVPQQLEIDTLAPFLVWPIAALASLLWRVYSAGDGSHDGGRHVDEIDRA